MLSGARSRTLTLSPLHILKRSGPFIKRLEWKKRRAAKQNMTPNRETVLRASLTGYCRRPGVPFMHADCHIHTEYRLHKRYKRLLFIRRQLMVWWLMVRTDTPAPKPDVEASRTTRVKVSRYITRLLKLLHTKAPGQVVKSVDSG